jgi:hypothetical protein
MSRVLWEVAAWLCSVQLSVRLVAAAAAALVRTSDSSNSGRDLSSPVCMLQCVSHRG